MIKIAIFPGSFDPITNGHLDIIQRANLLFDKIIIGVGNNRQKKYFFSIEKRLFFVKKTLYKYHNIKIKKFHGLTINFCLKEKAKFIIRGLRNYIDFEFEKNIAHNNYLLSNKKIETIFFIASIHTSHISSSSVKEFITYKGNYKIMVPKIVRI